MNIQDNQRLNASLSMLSMSVCESEMKEYVEELKDSKKRRGVNKFRDSLIDDGDPSNHVVYRKGKTV